MEEFQFLKTLFSKLEDRFIKLPSGPGDDCATFTSIETILVSQDVLVEGVHFKFSWSSPKDIAWKALATNESDIASMGGKPIGYTIGLVIPDGYGEMVEELYVGFNEYLLARESLGYFQKILGGDISSGPCFSISVSVLGECLNPVPRSGAKPGDILVSSGPIGLAGIGLSILNGSNKYELEDNLAEVALDRHRRPIPQTILGNYLSKNDLATSMIDISDGLIQDTMHLAEASGVSALIDPRSFIYPKNNSNESLVRLLNAGDDYELIFSLRSLHDFLLIKQKFPQVFVVGKIVEQDKNTLMFESDGSRLTLEQFVGSNIIPTGFAHSF